MSNHWLTGSVSQSIEWLKWARKKYILRDRLRSFLQSLLNQRKHTQSSDIGVTIFSFNIATIAKIIIHRPHHYTFPGYPPFPSPLCFISTNGPRLVQSVTEMSLWSSEAILPSFFLNIKAPSLPLCCHLVPKIGSFTQEYFQLAALHDIVTNLVYSAAFWGLFSEQILVGFYLLGMPLSCG